MINNHSLDDFVLPDEDKEKLKYVTVPVPENESKRIGILQQTRLLDSSPNEPSFDRFTHLTSLIFDMPVSVISLVDVDRVWFKSRQGVDWTDVSRNDSFSAYLVMPDAPEVLVVPDVSADSRFRTYVNTYNGEAICFFAGAAVVVDGVKIGCLCVLDIVPHPEFDADDRENLLDICAGVSQLASERRQHILNLNAERANIVISMMHNLRTPMTTLNFASDMLRAEAEKFRPPKEKEKPTTTVGGLYGSSSQSHSKSKDDDDSGDEPEGIVLNPAGAASRSSFAGTLAATSIDTAQMTVTSATSLGQASITTGDGQGIPEAKSEEIVTNIDNIEPSFSTFDVCFREITVALKQLNLLVDSSLNLGQALVKINTSNTQQDTLHSESENRTLESMSATMSEQSQSFKINLSTVPSACPSKETTPKAGSIKGVARVGEFELYPEMRQSRLVVCDLLEHIDRIYHSLIHQVVGVSVSWEVNPAYLSLGKHASYPDAVGLVLITTLGQLNTQYRNVRVRFSFERFAHEDDLEYPTLRNKLVEGMLVIKVQSYTKSARSRRRQEHAQSGEAAAGVDLASEETAEPNLTQAAHHPRNMYNMQHPRDLHGNLLTVDTLPHATSTSGQSSTAVSPASITDGISESPPPRNSAEDLTNRYNSAYNLMSLNKVLRTLNGGCREYPEPIPDQPQYPNVSSAPKASITSAEAVGKSTALSAGDKEADATKRKSSVNFAAAQSDFPPVCTPTQEFWIPCKVLLSADNLAAMAAGKELLTEESVSQLVQRTKAHWGSHTVSKKNSVGYDYTSTSGKEVSIEGMSHLAATSIKISADAVSAGNSSFAVSKNRHASIDLTSSAGISNVEDSSAKSAASETRALPPSPKAELKVLRVLIIEDTIPVQKLLSRWMQKARCKVTCAGNGSIGLNQLMSNCFDIVFVDFLMPVMLGTTTMKHFQAWVNEHAETNEVAAYNKHMLVIGMSATALQSEQEAAFDYGMHFFCPKPANMDILSLMIEAKRQCRSNEEALDMICEATGTDAWHGQGEEEEEDEHQGQEFGDDVDVDVASPRAALPARAPSVGLMGLATVSLATESLDREGTDSNKCSTKSSAKGSDRGSGKEVNSVASEGEASAASAASAAGASNTSGTTGLAGANAVGVTSGSSISSHLSSTGMISLLAPTGKVVTDSKSAAMWSVFRSYRQSTRYTMPSTAGSSRQPSFLSAHSVQSGPNHVSHSVPEGSM